MWLAALTGRLAYWTHRAAGHAVTWKAASQNSSVCPGDIVCHECGQVLWCRAHDPWRKVSADGGPDHWGGTGTKHPRWALFEGLQHILKLAEECPPGPAGDAIRRAACELVEADGSRRLAACRRQMLNAVVRLEWRSRRQSRIDDPSPLMFRQLADALQRDLWPR